MTRLAEDRFLVVTGAAPQTRDMAWLKRHTPDDAHCVAIDITSGLPMIAVMGPKSRALLEKLSGADLSNAAFPFGTSQEIEIGYARVRASRITYVGELGWELYIPAEFAAHVFETLQAAGKEFGLTPAGMHTMNNCRMEKAYRHWGHDIADEDTPLEAGLGFAVAWDKPGGFIGREALLKQKATASAAQALGLPGAGGQFRHGTDDLSRGADLPERRDRRFHHLGRLGPPGEPVAGPGLRPAMRRASPRTGSRAASGKSNWPGSATRPACSCRASMIRRANASKPSWRTQRHDC